MVCDGEGSTNKESTGELNVKDSPLEIVVDETPLVSRSYGQITPLSSSTMGKKPV